MSARFIKKGKRLLKRTEKVVVNFKHDVAYARTWLVSIIGKQWNCRHTDATEWQISAIYIPFATRVHLKIMHQSIETPPFGSRGRVGDNRGIKSLLNNKLSPKGQERNLVPVFHMELPKMTEGAKKLRVVWSTHILLPLHHPMQLIFNLNQVMCFPLFACMHLLIYAWYWNLIGLFCVEIRMVSERSKVHVMTCSHLSFYPGFISVRRESESARTPTKSRCWCYS